MEKETNINEFMDKLEQRNSEAIKKKFELINKIKKHCQAEVQINEEYPWENITDGTEWISRGRLEFAEELLNQIKKWENE
tara:strand:+ start:816 stop:1055 length:240 start_codon:yes stop_codon:yes gene_type:complete